MTHRRSGGGRWLAAALAGVLVGCAALPATRPAQRHFRGEHTNRGPERYASWFGDSDGRILYFGLSPFNRELRRCETEGGGRLCPLSDLALTGDHLIGRFDMEAERFLEPLVVRSNDPETSSSVWDVLVHSNGRIYYTTVFDEFGSVRPDDGDVQHYPDPGDGLGELWEGPGGEIYAARYLGEKPGIAVFGPDGRLRREFSVPQPTGETVCPKSLTVDPSNGEIWFNSDVFHADGRFAGYRYFRVSAQLELLESRNEPTLDFLSFDPAGWGWFVENADDVWSVRIVRPDGGTTHAVVGSRSRLDFVQDVKHAGDVTLIATWGRRVFLMRAAASGPVERCELPAPELDCEGAPALGYTAALSARGGRIYTTVECDVDVVRVGSLDDCDWQPVVGS